MESQTLLKIVTEKHLMTEKYPNKLLSGKKKNIHTKTQS